MNITTIGFDIAKGVIQIHGVDGSGAVAVRKRLSRAGALTFFERLSPCLVGMEACGGGHHLGRELGKFGHTGRVILPLYVKTPVKSREAQALAQAYKTRGLLVAQRTALINALRAHLTEFGVVAPLGPAGAARLIGLVRGEDGPLPELARQTLVDLADMIETTHASVAAFDARLKRLAAQDEASRRLMK